MKGEYLNGSKCLLYCCIPLALLFAVHNYKMKIGDIDKYQLLL